MGKLYTVTEMSRAKILALSCTHAPFTPERTIEWLLGVVEREAKDVTHFIHLGDLFDASAASVHPNEYTHTLREEYDQAASLLSSIRKVLPTECKRVITMGNHDDNLRVSDPRRIPRALRELINPHLHHSEFSNWQWLPYEKSERGCYKVGQCVFYHGFDAGATSDETEALQFNNFTGCDPWRLFVRGHTHRPVDPTQCMRSRKIPLPWWYMNVGTCGPMKPDYMQRKDTSQWGSAIGIIECLTDRPDRMRTRNWSARLERML